MAHAEISPSGFYRLELCPGSHALERTVPRLPSSKFAAEGEAAHEVAPNAFATGIAAAEFLGSKVSVSGFEIEVDAEMVKHVQTYIDAVQQDAVGGQLYVEHRVVFGQGITTREAFGTADAIVVKRNSISIHDLKYGKGVPVVAKNNSQLALYAIGATAEFGLVGIEHIHMHIHQPRRNNHSIWTITPLELHEFATYAKGVIEQALSPDAPFVPGKKQCQFCNAKSVCPAVQATTSLAFDVLPKP